MASRALVARLLCGGFLFGGSWLAAVAWLLGGRFLVRPLCGRGCVAAVGPFSRFAAAAGLLRLLLSFPPPPWVSWLWAAAVRSVGLGLCWGWGLARSLCRGRCCLLAGGGVAVCRSPMSRA